MDHIESVQQAAIDEADAPIAVLDAAGTIIAVNRAWTRFGLENGRTPQDSDVGHTYPFEALPELGGFIKTGRRSVSVIYPCHSPMEERWFRLLVVRLRRTEPRCMLVIHRRLADAPTEDDVADAGLEMALRWEGIRTICAWCQERVRSPLGGWMDGSREPGVPYSHGLCDACAEVLAPPEEPVFAA